MVAAQLYGSLSIAIGDSLFVFGGCVGPDSLRFPLMMVDPSAGWGFSNAVYR